MNVETGTEAGQFTEKEYINVIFVQCITVSHAGYCRGKVYVSLWFPLITQKCFQKTKFALVAKYKKNVPLQ